MEWHLMLGIAAGILQVLSVVPYLHSMVRGTTRPNVISFALWTVLQCIAIAAQLSVGASWSVLLLIATTTNTFLIVVFCLFGYGYRKHGISEYLCLSLAIIAMCGWYFTGDPNVALLLAVVANMMAAVPTILKTYRVPRSENALGWYLTFIASLMSLFSTTVWNFANLVFPIYYLFESGSIATLASFGRRKKSI
ncbi:MAG: hypothetical protein QG636_186 [Patescibacteria group bacterium]|jgi:hypothetical protein|nr:hypothetical protein [Patescibacteria group bacterium]